MKFGKKGSLAWLSNLQVRLSFFVANFASPGQWLRWLWQRLAARSLVCAVRFGWGGQYSMALRLVRDCERLH